MKAEDIYKQWLEDPNIDEETREELRAIADDPAQIEDRFYQELEFGTAGLRGVIGAGTNRMNRYTVSKATKGLADYINGVKGGAERGVAIAYDSRHMSPEFADIAASVLNAQGIKAYVFEALRPTPELSFAVRELKCIAGINITASHNPAEYNGYKVYWEDGAQVTPPHDTGIMDCVNAVTDLTGIPAMDRDEAMAKGLYVELGKDMDDKYVEAILALITEEEIIEEVADKLNIVYTPLHGTGITVVPGALEDAGFKNIHIVKEQQVPDGAFPTVSYPNPEVQEAFDLADALSKEVDADIALATDPDADRIGVHVKDKDGNYHALDGNLIGALLCEYVLSTSAAHGGIHEDGYVVRSIVSGRMVDAICENYGVELIEVLTGFKNIGKTILEHEEKGEGTFLFGFEESYGYLEADYARDKDACGTALVLCEMAAYYKSFGITLWEAVLSLYEKYGVYKEKTISVTKKGKSGIEEIKADMEALRSNPPANIGGYDVVSVLDYNEPETTGLPKANVLMFNLDNGWIAVRPSGTEPKIKYYIGVKAPSEATALAMIEDIKKGLGC